MLSLFPRVVPWSSGVTALACAAGDEEVVYTGGRDAVIKRWRREASGFVCEAVFTGHEYQARAADGCEYPYSLAARWAL